MPIGATIGAAVIGGGTSIVNGIMGSNAANQAANTQAASADRSLALQAGMYAQGREDSLPWMNAGRTALNSYMGELGISDEARNGTFRSGFQQTPGYQFAVRQGERGVTNNLAALGMKNSGAALKALTNYRMGMANQEYGTYMDRLSGASVGGQTTAANQGQLGANAANSMGTSIMDAGTARASGYVGSANSWQNALTGVANNAGSALGWMGGGNSPMRVGYQAGV